MASSVESKMGKDRHISKKEEIRDDHRTFLDAVDEQPARAGFQPLKQAG
jgi:hypothetical protein